jgi:nicotinate-nucleotide adenylyltransferase
MVAGNPALKDTGKVSEGQYRFDMTQLAVASNPDFRASRIELDRAGPTYTVDTLRELKASMGADTELYFITGADAVFEILSWKESAALTGLATFIAATRPGYDIQAALALHEGAELSFDLRFLEVPALAVSSTDLRGRLAAGQSVRYLVPPEVEAYIHAHGLYGTGERYDEATPARSEPEPEGALASLDVLTSEIVARLKQRLNEYGYRHSLGCAETCGALARLYGVDVREAQLAGLLHDWDRCVPWPELLDKARELGLEVTPEVLAAPPILHAQTGAADVARIFPQVPRAVITAILHHTVGAPDMADLDKVLYIADMIEPTRTNPHIAPLREMVGTVSLDTLFTQAYQCSMLHLVRHRKVMHPDTTRVWNALMLKNAGGGKPQEDEGE